MNAHPSSHPCRSTSTPPRVTQDQGGSAPHSLGPLLLWPVEGVLGDSQVPSGRGGAGKSCLLSQSPSGPQNSLRGSHCPWGRPLCLTLQLLHPQALRKASPVPRQCLGLPTSVPLHQAPPAGASSLLRLSLQMPPTPASLTPLFSPPCADSYLVAVQSLQSTSRVGNIRFTCVPRA